MNIIRREQYGILTLELTGRVDSAGAGELETALNELLDQGHFRIVLDMAGVQYINSAGLRTLADAVTRARSETGGADAEGRAGAQDHRLRPVLRRLPDGGRRIRRPLSDEFPLAGAQLFVGACFVFGREPGCCPQIAPNVYDFLTGFILQLIPA